MTREQTLSHMQRCRELAERSEPMTLDEMREYARLRAEEMARAERLRDPSPQLPLGEVA
ncbi:hypothetical protein [Xanthomonas sp. LMG 12461]|uniref:hypothetical protein n=1 Tax=Xanthomonas sp. LMG 12461 TaxID=2014543 RepID=UPI00186AF295|nr:hypothetical protein [Xanthomonas sp. LMG 12461]